MGGSDSYPGYNHVGGSEYNPGYNTVGGSDYNPGYNHGHSNNRPDYNNNGYNNNNVGGSDYKPGYRGKRSAQAIETPKVITTLSDPMDRRFENPNIRVISRPESPRFETGNGRVTLPARIGRNPFLRTNNGRNTLPERVERFKREISHKSMRFCEFNSDCPTGEACAIVPGGSWRYCVPWVF